MNSKNFLDDKEKRFVSGNSTKISPETDVISYYHGYAMTAFNDNIKTPEDKVIYAKHFVDENHK